MEWCLDYYGPYSEEAQTNPTGAAATGDNNACVVRGGGYWDSADWCRNTKRLCYAETHSQMDIGLRLVLIAE